jgi:hypothetical protein
MIIYKYSVWDKKWLDGYLSNRVHLEKLRSFVGNTHLKIWNQLNLDAGVFSGNQSLVSILVFLGSVKDLQIRRRNLINNEVIESE